MVQYLFLNHCLKFPLKTSKNFFQLRLNNSECRSNFVPNLRVPRMIDLNQPLQIQLIDLQPQHANQSLQFLKLFFSDQIFLTQKQPLEVLQFFEQELTILFLLSHLIFSSQVLRSQTRLSSFFQIYCSSLIPEKLKIKCV